MLNKVQKVTAFCVVVIAGSANLLPSQATACPYSIRDSAFIGGDALPSYQLLLITDSSDESIRDSIDAARTAWLTDANVVAEIVPTDSATVRALGDRLSISDPPADGLTAVLVSPQGGARLLDTLGPDQVSLDAVMDMVASAVDSPLRARLRDELVEALCVLLVLSGDDPSVARRVAREARLAGERIVGTTNELDKIVQRPPLVIVLDKDDADEQVLLWSLGLVDEQSEPTDVRLIMLTGRGELRGPVLRGEQATEEAIHGLLEMLGRSCSCTTDDSWLSGPVIPLEWGEDLQAAVQKELGFDPDDPEAVGAITGVMAGLEGALDFDASSLGYQESFVDPGMLNPAENANEDSAARIDPRPSTSLPETTDVLQASERQQHADGRKHDASPSSGLFPMSHAYRIGGAVFAGTIALLVIASMFMLRNTVR